MKKLFITVLIILLVTPSAGFSIDRINKSPDEVLSECKNYIDTIKQSRYIMYNVLSLTDEQIEQYDKVITQNNPQYQKIFDELINETYILCTMEKVNSTLKEKNCRKKKNNLFKKGVKNNVKK